MGSQLASKGPVKCRENTGLCADANWVPQEITTERRAGWEFTISKVRPSPQFPIASGLRADSWAPLHPRCYELCGVVGCGPQEMVNMRARGFLCPQSILYRSLPRISSPQLPLTLKSSQMEEHPKVVNQGVG